MSVGRSHTLLYVVSSDSSDGRGARGWRRSHSGPPARRGLGLHCMSGESREGLTEAPPGPGHTASRFPASALAISAGACFRRGWHHAVCLVLVVLLLAACSAGSPPPAMAPPPPPPPAPAPPPPPPPPPAPAPAPSSPSVIDRPAPSALPAFPWPPPRQSAFAELERAWLVPQEPATLGAAAKRLEEAFDRAGYVERSYYRVPGGFALASRAEKIHSDASPFPAPARWSADPAGAGRGFLERIKAVFNAPPGHYRIIVFVVTDQDFATRPQPTSEAVAREWVSGGGLRLPPSIAGQPYSAEHYASALIYEFARRNEREEGQLRTPSDVPGRAHLEKGGLWQALAAQ